LRRVLCDDEHTAWASLDDCAHPEHTTRGACACLTRYRLLPAKAAEVHDGPGLVADAEDDGLVTLPSTAARLSRQTPLPA